MAAPLIPVIVRFLVKQGAKTVVKQGAKTVVKQGAKTVVKQGAKTAAKKAAKTAAKKGAKTAAKKGAKTAAKRVAKGATKSTIFNKTISKLGLIGGTAWAASSVLSTTLTNSGFMLPAVLGAAAGTYGFYKVSKITQNRVKRKDKAKENQENTNDQGDLVEYSEALPLEKMSPEHIEQISKLSPKQIMALRTKKYKGASKKLKQKVDQAANSKKLKEKQIRDLRAQQYEKAA